MGCLLIDKLHKLLLGYSNYANALPEPENDFSGIPELFQQAENWAVNGSPSCLELISILLRGQVLRIKACPIQGVFINL